MPLSPRTLTSAEVLRVELAKVRSQGWALVDQELEEGLRSVAAPIRDRNGRTIAAVNLSAHASRMSIEEGRRRLVPALLATAARIEADLRIALAGATATIQRRMTPIDRAFARPAAGRLVRRGAAARPRAR